MRIYITEENWKLIFSLPFKESDDTKVQTLQFRINHRIFYTNSFIIKKNIKESEQCSFCNVAREAKSRKYQGVFEVKKSSKDMASSRNLVSTNGALASPKMGDGTRCPGRVSVPCWLATPVANAPWKPLIIR